jgi:hypothetical protein
VPGPGRSAGIGRHRAEFEHRGSPSGEVGRYVVSDEKPQSASATLPASSRRSHKCHSCGMVKLAAGNCLPPRRLRRRRSRRIGSISGRGSRVRQARSHRFDPGIVGSARRRQSFHTIAPVGLCRIKRGVSLLHQYLPTNHSRPWHVSRHTATERNDAMCAVGRAATQDRARRSASTPPIRGPAARRALEAQGQSPRRRIGRPDRLTAGRSF